MEQRQGREGSVRVATGSVAVAGCAISRPTAGAVLRALDRPRVVWSSGDLTVVGGGAADVVTADGPDRFEAVRNRGADLLDGVEPVDSLPAAARPRLFGGFAFHDAHGDDVDEPWNGFPGAQFVLPAVQVTITPDGAWLTTADSGEEAAGAARTSLDRWRERIAALPELRRADPPGISAERPTPDREGWRAQVESALGQVRGGDLRKVVLAQSLDVELAADLAVPDVLRRLGETYPDCTLFCVEPVGAGRFFGATPERLVAVEGRDVWTDILAGSTGRGDTVDEDEWLAQDLRTSEKDIHEHEVVLDAVRDQLAPLTLDFETGPRRVRKLATVQHLQTPVSARLDGDRHVLELVEALHPTPAVGGMPQDPALRTIRETEGFDRGWYAAPVGWFDADGDGEFAVAIRSAVAHGETATLFAGAGIVGDSNPDSEWDELQLKYRPVLDELA